MESGNRTVWIVVVVAAVLLLCCCALAAGAALTGLLTTVPLIQETWMSRVEERTEQVFRVGDAPTVDAQSFAGSITVRRREIGEVRIIVTKRAPSSSALERINVDVYEQEGGVRIRTSHPGISVGNVSVDLEMSVPSDAELDLDTGAGKVEVTDVEGRISAHTGAGSVEVRGAAGSVALDTGAGEVDYEGMPRGSCTFSSGAGSITLRLPEDANVEVDLSTGVGNINLGSFDIEGDTSGTDVQGVIGTGEEATIEAHTGVGSITLVSR
jgi:DUF4097 and DUF4098 domain-containing protein YvlB